METDSLLEKRLAGRTASMRRCCLVSWTKGSGSNPYLALRVRQWCGFLRGFDHSGFAVFFGNTRSFKLKDVELGYYNAALAVGILIGCMPTSLADSWAADLSFAYVFALL